jgi:hypothetical protein
MTDAQRQAGIAYFTLLGQIHERLTLEERAITKKKNPPCKADPSIPSKHHDFT